ncbi:putative sulfate/molybdate transporter [Pseudodesulfovibrio sp.]|uniref:putative sulfate/molybdate transporter n=1 Tax=Pseudodesulfovibrio sp. TaxID=2035812 RepID=UPI0026162650|nr:putative sulfate/molybdate transporter [Pseudodesulfovibrio sp.]MDD3313712.1 putative sulfate/molybdate transporter [Pseudodesulfovibrio sp.]
MIPIRINRHEFAGSLGDLGVLLPMAAGLIMVNGIDPQRLFLGVGLFYIAAGLYFGTTVPVQPMKVISSLAIAMALPREQIFVAGLLVGVMLVIIGLTGAMTRLSRYIPRPVIRGVQLSTGLLLMAQGARFALGTSSFQVANHAAEPFLAVQTIGPVPLNWILAAVAFAATFFLLDSRKVPAALVVVGFGLATGIILSNGGEPFNHGSALPAFLPAEMTSLATFSTALFVLALPQLPMTLGNAVVANADLARELFGPDSARTTNRALCLSMGLANIGSFLLGGMPMCHGAGGLATHYRFGARSAGSNLIIGGLFASLALFLGEKAGLVARMIPMSVLGVLLFFGGGQLALTVQDMKERSDLFVCLAIAAVTLASNLALGYLVGAGLYFALKSGKAHV